MFHRYFLFHHILTPSTIKRKAPIERLFILLEKKAKIDPPDQNEAGVGGREIELEETLSASRKKNPFLYSSKIRRKNKKIKTLWSDNWFAGEVINFVWCFKYTKTGVFRSYLWYQKPFHETKTEIQMAFVTTKKPRSLQVPYIIPPPPPPPPPPHAAYEYVRAVFALPSVSSLSKLTSSSSMYSIDFKLRWTKIQRVPTNIVCILCDAVAIKSSKISNEEKGCFDGFINYVENIIV